MTRKDAIRKKCLDCCNGSRVEVRLCPLTTCALYPFRLGVEEKQKNPQKTLSFKSSKS